MGRVAIGGQPEKQKGTLSSKDVGEKGAFEVRKYQRPAGLFRKNGRKCVFFYEISCPIAVTFRIKIRPTCCFYFRPCERFFSSGLKCRSIQRIKDQSKKSSIWYFIAVYIMNNIKCPLVDTHFNLLVFKSISHE